jgi:ABC-type nitrate/sulfonate/bicarbonate transport system substrate-binding protein
MKSCHHRLNRFTLWSLHCTTVPLWTGVVMALLAFAAFVPEAAAQTRPKVVIGVGIDATYGEIFVAVDKGFFARQGIDAEFKTFEAGGMTIAAAAAGTVQVGAAGELPGMKPVSDGARVVYVATGVYTGRSGGTGVVAGIRKPDDLVGKKVAVLKGSTSELYQTLFFRKHGLDGKVTVVNVAVPEMIPAMARGDVQAIFVWDPWLARMQETVPNSSVPWRYGSDGVYELHWGYWFNRDFVEKTPEVAEKTLLALIQAAEWINANKDEAAEIIAKPTRTPKADILKQMADLRYAVDLRRENLQHYQDNIVPFAIKQGLIKPVDAKAFVESFFYTQLIKKVAPNLTDF